LKIPRLPRFDLSKFQKKKDIATGKKYANPVFDEWKESAVADLANRQIRFHVVRKCIFCFAVLCVIAASSVLTGYYASSRQQEVEKVIARGNSLLNEYGKIIKDLETYERYAQMKLKVPLYIQFATLVSSSKLGFFVDSLSFEQAASLGNLKESFVVETGQNADSVKILGMWKMKGLLMQDVDNRWAISFKDSVEGMFSLFGMKSYVSASLRDTDMEATVILYE
jgi:hypothetical protein